jgi:hypothetical protein
VKWLPEYLGEIVTGKVGETMSEYSSTNFHLQIPLLTVSSPVSSKNKNGQEVLSWPFTVIPLGQLVILLGVILSY